MDLLGLSWYNFYDDVIIYDDITMCHKVLVWGLGDVDDVIIYDDITMCHLR